MKKILALILSLSLLAICAGGLSALAEETREDYVIDVLMPEYEDMYSLDDPIGQYIYEKFGIIFNIIGYAGDWEERCALYLAAGDYPEIIQLQGNTMLRKYIDANAVLDIGELAESCGAENFLARHADSIPYWKMACGTDELYKFEGHTPDLECATGAMFDMMVRSDILEEQGWPRMLTEDDYITVLKKALEDHPTTDGEDTVGITFAGGEDWMLTCFMGFDRGGYTEVSCNNSVMWDNQNDVFIDKFSHPYQKAALKFLNRMYQEGILDEEVFTQSSATVTEHLQSGRALSSWYITWEQDGANVALREAGKENMEYVTMPNMFQEMLDNGEKRMIRILDTYDWQSIVITKNCKDPQRLMELIDWASTDEGQIMLGWGIEGVHYTVNDEGLREVTDESYDCYLHGGDYNKGLSKYWFLGLTSDFDVNGQIYERAVDANFRDLAMSDRNREVYEAYGWHSMTDPWQANEDFEYELIHTGLAGTVALDSTSEESAMDTRLSEYFYNHIAKLILAEDDEEFESLYAQYLEEYNALGTETVVKAYNEVYDGIKAKFAELQG